jgi:fructokinase
VRIGIDLGGTKIEAILLDPAGRELTRRRIESPRGDYQATLRTLGQLVRDIEQAFSISAHVGVGIPGAISPSSGLVKNANSVWLIGQPLQRDLSTRLSRPVRLANDADCFTVSEATDGAAAGARSVFGVILGTGVGGGLCWEGRLIEGPNAIAGEWGHNPIPWPDSSELVGLRCYCGKTDCLETVLSGPGLQRAFHHRSGKDCSPQEINDLAFQGCADAEDVLTRYEHRLARGLATIINVFDPECIVLGGGLSNLDRLYQHVPKLWTTWVFSDEVVTQLLPPKHGDSSGVRGAAWLWPPT